MTTVGDAPADPPFLRIENLTKRFGAFEALKDVSLNIERGELVCFLGPSGCGKTTLLRAIAGLDIHSTGRIWQDGEEISALPPEERDFGIVFQSYALFPNLTIERNVGYGLENRGIGREQVKQQVADLLALVGLADQSVKHPAQLSGGQQQRVALARALATSPGLLLLDEPLSALDAKVRAHLRHEIKDLQRRIGVTTILVTHDQEEALTMADRIVVMNHGVIEQIGTPEEIYGKPASAFVADFIGAMNFLDGRLIGPERATVGGVELACTANGIASAGDFASNAAVTLAIRPEDILLRDVQGDEENAIQVELQDLEFMGSFIRARLDAKAIGGGILEADLSINLIRGRNLTPGQSLPIVLPRDHLLVYSASHDDG
ncbi:MAG: putative 2-aminoethylphosphonate ABC transporter ATP-binding protein [Alphaproteobacteria bacterium]|nr:putative 2-aminoethylphosphonate ABC transporter ATP-binding protein [Alphaproteobacteria bacterium]